MSVGFFVSVGRSELDNDRMDSAFVAHTMWAPDGRTREIDLQGRNWRVICLKDCCSGTSRIWRESETGPSDLQGCFVLLLGSCYRISESYELPQAQDYRQMLARFRAGAPPLSDDFGGHFVAVVFDAQRQRLAVQPDRLASQACYFAESAAEFAVSNRALRVASYFGAALDGHSVLSHMRGTHMPFGRTLFSGVRRLMGSSYIDFDLAEGRAQLKKTDSLFVPTRKISYGDSVDLVAETLKNTIRRLLAAGPTRFDLTGGNDTRVLASAIDNVTHDASRQDFAFRVADPEGSPDVELARRVAGACGWPLVRMDRGLPGQATIEELARAATTGDGSFSLNSIWERVLSERIYAQQYQAKTHVGASAGEIFRGYFYAHEMLSLGRSSNVNYEALLAYRTYASRGVDLRIFGVAAPTFETHDQILLAPYRAIGDEGGSLPNTHKLDFMYLQRHCYRSGNAISWLSGFLNVRLPFLSWELAGLAVSLPWKYRANRELIVRVIRKLSPRLTDIPNKDGQPMKPFSLRTLPSYVAAELPILIDGGSRVLRRWFGRSGGTTRVALPSPHPAYFAILNDAKSLSSVFDPASLRSVGAVASSQQNSRDSVTMFYTLCTIELLLQEAPTLQRRIVFD